MFSSFRQQIAIPFVLLIVLLMVGLGVYLSSFLRQIYLNNLNTQLIADAKLIGDGIENILEGGVGTEALDPLAKRWSELIDLRVTIIAPDGIVLGESNVDRSQMENHGDRPEFIAAIASGTGISTRFSRTTGYQTIYVAIPVYVHDDLVAIARVSLPLEEADESIARLQRTLFGITILATSVAVILAILIANSTTKPLRELTDAVTQLASSDLKQQSVPGRLIPSKLEELSRLTQAYNNMARQLHSQFIELENERNKVEDVLEEMTDGVIMVDSMGQIQMINPSAREMFGLPAEDAMGSTLAEGLRHHQVVELWQRCRDTSRQQTSTMEISTNKLYLQGIATPLGQSSIPGGILLIFQNLTRQRFLETVRSDFISNISHELRTPLASLKALTETLHEGALEDPPAAKRFLGRMEKEVDAITHMVTELLELSRIESGRVPMEMRPTSPDDVLYPSVDRLREQLERAGLDVSVECPGDLPLIMADQARLEQVVVNLLHNAVKFTSVEGSVTLRAEPYETDQIEGEYILFSVSDTGAGIPADDLPRIFERFYKADRARSSRGTGLGLAIARHTVEAHQGRIWAESREGQGSTFYFTIPSASQALKNEL